MATKNELNLKDEIFHGNEYEDGPGDGSRKHL
jgi:hypothetical protein